MPDVTELKDLSEFIKIVKQLTNQITILVPIFDNFLWHKSFTGEFNGY